MKVFSYDTETWGVDLSIHPAPPIVCCSWQAEGEAAQIAKGAQTAVIQFCRLMKDPEAHCVGANIPFDLGCLVVAEPALGPKIFKWLEEGRIHDIQVRERLHDIARGCHEKDPLTGKPFHYSLASLEERYFGRDRSVEKTDGWRMRYAELEDVELSRWPAEARQYPLNDAKGTLQVFLAQKDHKNLQCEPQEMRAAWALKCMSLRGIRTDPKIVAEVTAEVETEYQEGRARFVDIGFVVKRKPKGGKTPETPDAFDENGVPFKYAVKKAPIQERVSLAYAGNPPLTESGQVSTNSDTLEESSDAVLEAWAATQGAGKLRSTYIPVVQSGTERPIHVSFNSILDTQRCSCREPNLQNLPRSSRVRECFCARPGYVLVSTDYGTLEMATLAEICFRLFGHSKMRDALNDGRDVHAQLAADMLGISYEEGAKRKAAKDEKFSKARQMAKEPNFGFGGLMGAPKLVLRARHAKIRFCELAGELEKCGSEGKVHEYYGRQISPTCAVCLRYAQKFKELYFNAWPEVREYHALTTALAESDEPLESISEGNMLRLETNPGACANHFFQGFAAVLAKDAAWTVTRAFLDPTAGNRILFGNGAPLLFIHDEILSEVRTEVAHECAMEQSRLMVEVAKRHCKTVLVKAPPALMPHWYKGAEEVYANGRLIPWEPK